MARRPGRISTLDTLGTGHENALAGGRGQGIRLAGPLLSLPSCPNSEASPLAVFGILRALRGRANEPEPPCGERKGSEGSRESNLSGFLSSD